MKAHRTNPTSRDALIETAARVSGRCANVARFGSSNQRYRIACELALIEEVLNRVEPLIEAESRMTLGAMRTQRALPPGRKVS